MQNKVNLIYGDDKKRGGTQLRYLINLRLVILIDNRDCLTMSICSVGRQNRKPSQRLNIELYKSHREHKWATSATFSFKLYSQ